MRVTFAAGTAPIFEFEGNSAKEIFEKLAAVQALFNESHCGCCKSKNIVYEKREIDNGMYLELRCLDCRAQLAYGQNKDGKNLFVKKWDKEAGAPMPNGGWFIYQKDGEKKASTQQTSDKPKDTPEEIPW